MNTLAVLAILYVIALAATLLGWPIYELTREPVRRWWLRRGSERARDERRLEGWAATLRKMNLSDKVGVLYTGRHCVGTPVSQFVVLTYSAGPRHRLVTS